MLKKWIVCAALAALVGVAPAPAEDGDTVAEVVQVGAASATATLGAVGAGVPWSKGWMMGFLAKANEPTRAFAFNLSWTAAIAPAAFATYGVYKLVDARRRKAAERAECDPLPRFQPRELREQGVENRVQCRRRHRGVEPGRFQPTFNRQASREFTPTRESCAAYWRLSPRFRVQCRGVALERLDAWAASGPDQPSAVLPAAAVERLRADALERQRFDEIAQERWRRAIEQAPAAESPAAETGR